MMNAESLVDAAVQGHRFKRLQPSRNKLLCDACWKLQTLNFNRAVAIASVHSLPPDVHSWLREIRKEVAFRCGFFPVFYGIGIQLVIEAEEVDLKAVDLGSYVDKVDNQWSIIQSVFLFSPKLGLIAEARTWGQIVTGKYQDSIQRALASARQKNA